MSGFYSLNDILAKMNVNKTPVFLLYIVENARTNPRLVMTFGTRAEEKAATEDNRGKYVEQAQEALRRCVEVETAALGDNVLFEITLKTAATTNDSGTYPNQRFTKNGTPGTVESQGLAGVAPASNPLAGLDAIGGIAGFTDYIRKDAVLSIREEMLKREQETHRESVAREREELKALRDKYENHTDQFADVFQKGLMGLISAFSGNDAKALAGVETDTEPAAEASDAKRDAVEDLATMLYNSPLTAEQIAILKTTLPQ